MDKNDSDRQSVIEASRTLDNVRFGLLGAFELLPRKYIAFQRGRLGKLVWDRDIGSDRPLEAYRAVEEFLLEKQIFFGRERQNPSFPPDRATCDVPLNIAFRIGGREFQSEFGLIVSLFSEYDVLTILLYTEFSQISVDELIFIKGLKWYKSDNDCCIWIGPEQDPADSIYDAMHQILRGYGSDPLSNLYWPIFDFVELSDYGPAVGEGPNEESRLHLNEHWGLLSGDEGYRYIDAERGPYSATLTSEDIKFRGRSYFLYQFFPTSCLSFMDAEVDEIKEVWRKYYKKSVNHLPVLDS